MKRLVLLSLLGAIGFLPYRAAAQISVNVNIGSQPLWGPVGYDRADYYYLPDIESYYYVPTRQFIYLNGSRWIFSRSLSSRYRGYDLYSGYKVVMNSRDPYYNFHNDRVRYARYVNYRGQNVIRYSRDPRYYVIKEHPYRRSGREDRRYTNERYSSDNRGRGEENWNRGDRDRGRDSDGRGGREHGRGRH